jgi:hypothetical protein
MKKASVVSHEPFIHSLSIHYTSFLQCLFFWFLRSDYHELHVLGLSAMPSSMPSSAPTGQPTTQPTSKPSVYIAQPSSRPTGLSENPLFAGNGVDATKSMNGLDTQTAIIVFSCVGAVVLCLFILFTCYFQDKFYNHKEEDKLHNLVEQHYNDDEVVLDDGDGNRYTLYLLFIFTTTAIYGFTFSVEQ